MYLSKFTYFELSGFKLLKLTKTLSNGISSLLCFAEIAKIFLCSGKGGNERQHSSLLFHTCIYSNYNILHDNRIIYALISVHWVSALVVNNQIN